MGNPTSHRSAMARIGLRLGVAAVGLLVIATIVLLPFAVRSAIYDLTTPPTPRLYRLGPSQQPAPQHLRIHLTVAALDVVQQAATINVTAYQVCPAACTEAYSLQLISAIAEGPHDEGVPPSATVSIPAQGTEINDTVQLPLQGTPIRYPFDSFNLAFGAVLSRVPASGTPQPLTPAEVGWGGEGQVFLTLEEKVIGLDMDAPRELSADQIPVVGTVYPFLIVSKADFVRPFYLRTLSVLLVSLVVAAAAYAIFIQPVDQLVISVSALLLGIWGVRNVLVGQAGPPITAVDLSMSLVMLFLLAAIAVRTLTFLYVRSGLPLPSPLHARPTAMPDAAVEHQDEPNGSTPREQSEVTDLIRPGDRSQ